MGLTRHRGTFLICYCYDKGLIFELEEYTLRLDIILIVGEYLDVTFTIRTPKLLAF